MTCSNYLLPLNLKYRIPHVNDMVAFMFYSIYVLRPPVVPFFPLHFGVSLLSLNLRKKAHRYEKWGRWGT